MADMGEMGYIIRRFRLFPFWSVPSSVETASQNTGVAVAPFSRSVALPPASDPMWRPLGG